MLGKIIGATVGRKVARNIATKVGGPAGAAIGYGLVSRRFRKLALGGMAIAGGLAAVKALREGRPLSSLVKGDRDPVAATGTSDAPQTNGDPLPAYAPHA
ncbi:MAG: hypothetical protein V2J26_06195 [Pacificimonas sp.]|jgi:hypothetical protein|nr:hypothetical protein [Pacificimonas sp.]